MSWHMSKQDDENSRITTPLLTTADVLESTEELQSRLRMGDVCFMLDQLESVVQLLKRRKKLRPS